MAYSWPPRSGEVSIYAHSAGHVELSTVIPQQLSPSQYCSFGTKTLRRGPYLFCLPSAVEDTPAHLVFGVCPAHETLTCIRLFSRQPSLLGAFVVLRLLVFFEICSAFTLVCHSEVEGLDVPVGKYTALHGSLRPGVVIFF